jgi:hypothetical protein
LEPRFLRRSGYSHSWRNREQVPHFGFTRSHFSFRFRHETHEMVFSTGVPALSSPPVEGAGGMAAPFELLEEEVLA